MKRANEFALLTAAVLTACDGDDPYWGGYDADLVARHANDPIVNEATNGLKNLRGTIAMARPVDPHSATSQFFINLLDNSGFLDVPVTPVIILKATRTHWVMGVP